MNGTVLPEGWVVAAAPRVVSGKGLVCILRKVSQDAPAPVGLVDKMLEIDGRAYSVTRTMLVCTETTTEGLSYELGLVEFPPLEDAKEEAVDHPAHYGGEANPLTDKSVKVTIEAWNPESPSSTKTRVETRMAMCSSPTAVTVELSVPSPEASHGGPSRVVVSVQVDGTS